MFKNPHYQDLSLNKWVTHAPPQLIMDHLQISPETLRAIPADNSVVIGGKVS